MNRILLLGAMLFLSVADTGQADSQSARAQLERFSAQLETLHAQFEQRVIGTDGVTGDNSSGEVWLRRPGLFRWEYGGDFPEVVDNSMSSSRFVKQGRPTSGSCLNCDPAARKAISNASCSG